MPSSLFTYRGTRNREQRCHTDFGELGGENTALVQKNVGGRKEPRRLRWHLGESDASELLTDGGGVEHPLVNGRSPGG